MNFNKITIFVLLRLM